MATQQNYAQAAQQIQQAIASSGVNPKIIAGLGHLAHNAIKDKALYPLFVKQLEGYKLADPGELGNKINYKALSAFVAMGKIAEKMAGGAA
jgi:hypothetical protein